MNEETMRKLLSEELDRRDKEKQDACNHFRSGTIQKTGENSFNVVCDDCGKTMGEDEKKNAYSGEKNLPFTSIEVSHSQKEYVQKNKERGLS